MTCPYCGFGNHPVAECPERLEEYWGVPSDYEDEEEEEGEVRTDGGRDVDGLGQRLEEVRDELADIEVEFQLGPCSRENVRYAIDLIEGVLSEVDTDPDPQTDGGRDRHDVASIARVGPGPADTNPRPGDSR